MMFLKSKNFYLFIPILFLNFISILSFLLIYLQTIKTDINLYSKILNNSEFYTSLFYGLKISFSTILLSLILYFIIYYLLFLLKFKYAQDIRKWFFYLSIPILIPYSFCAFLFFLIFFPVGFFKDFLSFLLGSSYGVVIAYCYKVVPFFLLITFPNLLKISKDEINLHKIYCSSEFYFFKNILIKRVLSILFIAAFIVFSYIFNAFEIPSLLGSNIDKMPAIFVNERLQEFGSNSLNMAYGSSLLYFFITLSFSLVFFIIYKLVKKGLF